MEYLTPKTDWQNNPKSPMAEDFQRIEGNIAFLAEDFETKKTLIANAANVKGNNLNANSTHAQIAQGITKLANNPRMATGTANFGTPYGGASGKEYVDLNVTGLSFKPARVFVYGAVQARAQSDHYTGGTQTYPNMQTVSYAYNAGTLTHNGNMVVASNSSSP